MRRRDDDKQRRIKEAVMHLILEEGFADTSISKIAKRAHVAPATVYVYYESKEAMLRDIYTEYSEEVFRYLRACANPGMSAAETVEALMRGYYRYIGEHAEVFSFVEQFSQCPKLAGSCGGKSEACLVFSLIDGLKASGGIRDYDNHVLSAAMFYPVKAVAVAPYVSQDAREAQLAGIIEIVKRGIVQP